MTAMGQLPAPLAIPHAPPDDGEQDLRDEREMEGMNMDWIRRDLANLPEMSPTQLRDFMPRHRSRMMRLMEMHQG